MEIGPNKIYEILLGKFGNLNWWPMDKDYHEKNGSDPRYEIIVGAILTQNTAWSNVEKALKNLKSERILDIKDISSMNIKKLQELIRPSGFFNQKARRLKELTSYLENKYNGDLNNFFNKDLYSIRQELLSINGIGPETADSILLYAGNLPIFVVDAYTKRLCKRLPLDSNISYVDIQQYFQSELCRKYSKKDITRVYNELHAQIVMLAKNYCKKKPLCDDCPLKKHCMYSKKLF